MQIEGDDNFVNLLKLRAINRKTAVRVAKFNPTIHRKF